MSLCDRRVFSSIPDRVGVPEVRSSLRAVHFVLPVLPDEHAIDSDHHNRHVQLRRIRQRADGGVSGSRVQEFVLTSELRLRPLKELGVIYAPSIAAFVAVVAFRLDPALVICGVLISCVIGLWKEFGH
jgi:hypothetical protein